MKIKKERKNKKQGNVIFSKIYLLTSNLHKFNKSN